MSPSDRPLQVVRPGPNETRREAVTCGHPGCHKTTHGGKPLCSDHVDAMPYVQGLIETLADRRRRIA